jgi:hypothetical protein
VKVIAVDEATLGTDRISFWVETPRSRLVDTEVELDYALHVETQIDNLTTEEREALIAYCEAESVHMAMVRTGSEIRGLPETPTPEGDWLGRSDH